MVDSNAIRENMDVIASDGELVGTVGGFGGEEITVTRAGGGSGTVPIDWVSRVDDHVHLLRSGPVVRAAWDGTTGHPHRTEGRAKAPWIIGSILILIALVLLIWGFVYNFQATTRPSDEVVPATRVSVEDPGAATRG